VASTWLVGTDQSNHQPQRRPPWRNHYTKKLGKVIEINNSEIQITWERVSSWYCRGDIKLLVAAGVSKSGHREIPGIAEGARESVNP